MTIEPGSTLTFATNRGVGAEYTVRAVRHYPIDFVELEPVAGGAIRTAPLAVAERAAQGPGWAATMPRPQTAAAPRRKVARGIRRPRRR